jgi:CxxC motif-containing protein (DUF1111 family)
MDRKWMVTALAFSGLVFAQVGPPQGGPGRPGGANQPQATGLGAPLAGLTPRELAAFNDGRADFLSVEVAATGLGPLFNGRSCVECHGVPAAGGSSNTKVVRFGRLVNGVFDPMEAQGGSLLQRFALSRDLVERVPAAATIVAERDSTALFGLGLIEAIPDDAIRAQAARPKPDGVGGRAAVVRDVASGEMRVGRFGWKAQQATLLAFAGDAYRNEMGITNRFFPTENAPNGDTARIAGLVGPGVDDAVDPATGRGETDALADFMRLLAPPARGAINASVQAGEALFTQIGCAACHTPTLNTGAHAVAALANKPVNLYSDLLLHDMGSLNDGIAQDGARVNEMKTPPLWGLRFSAPYLHDGRAATVDLAVRGHDGEGRPARDRYNGLTPQLRQQVLDLRQWAIAAGSSPSTCPSPAHR